MAKPTAVAVLPPLYDLMLWYMPKLAQYPKRYKYTLGERLVHGFLEALEGLIEAQFSKASTTAAALQRVNLALEKLRFLIRLSKDLQCISLKDYEYAARQLVEVGKMVGGWRKHSLAQAPRSG